MRVRVRVSTCSVCDPRCDPEWPEPRPGAACCAVVVECVAELARQHPTRVAYVVLDAADYGVGSNRTRCIASTPAVITALKQMPVQRVSVAEALAAAGLPLPAEHLKSNTSNRDGTPCMRSTQQPAFTVTASHPLIWCTRAGVTVRCLNVAESAALMGFPPDWKLPLGSRAGLRAVGNAVPPPLARAVMVCATSSTHEPSPLAPPEHERRAGNELAGLRRKLRRLTRRVDALEGRAIGP